MVCFGSPGSPNHVLGVSKSVSTGPAGGTVLLTIHIVLKYLLRNFMAVQIYKKLYHVETGYNINRLLVWAFFGIARVDKICLFDFILAFLGVHGCSSGAWRLYCHRQLLAI